MQLRRTPTGTRRGVILLVVLAMLTLFAVAGITFVLYAEAAAESARINRGAETFSSTGAPDMDPNAAFSLFLGQFIYGVADPTAASGAAAGASALRGHSLAETMYGSYDANGTVPSDAPFNGTGRLSEPNLYAGTDGNQMVNYTYFSNADPTFLRDPSRPGSRPAGPPNTPLSNSARTTYTGGQNPPYTYPDQNNMFLASVNSSTGQVAMPSYLRPWLFANDWNSAQGKYKTLRPRPLEMGPNFPMPDPATGCDVKNLVGAPGGNDSIWIDIGAPELTTASGLRYKMLVAPLVLDLDSRLNVNVAGNVMRPGNTHAGNQAWGPWEVNLSKVLNPIVVPASQAAATAEWENLFLGVGATTGRYGAGKLPTATFTPTGGAVPHVYFPGDLNGLNDPGQANAGQPTGLYALPGQTIPASGLNQVPYQGFPNFPTNGYGNNSGGFLETTANGTSLPYNHAMMFNPMSASAGNRLFTIQNNGSLLWAGVNASSSTDLVQLCGKFNFVSPDPATDPNGTKRRLNQTTVLSMDLDRGGATPYVYDPTAPAYGVSFNAPTNQYSYGTPAANPLASPFPPLASHVPPPPNTTPAGSEFDPTTWRSVLPAALARIDLNRTLAVYPASGVQPADRQQFAQDIYTRLVNVTGMAGVNSTLAAGNPISQQQYNTLTWLAQLSANIVDYIDTDDVMTSFQWNTHPMAPDTGFVFGTELPKLALNEVYLQYQNDPADPTMVKDPNNPGKTKNVAVKPYRMNVWAELLNPLPSGADINGSNQAVLQNAAGTAIYEVVLTQPNAHLRDPQSAGPQNVLGDPDNPAGSTWVTQPLSPTGVYTTGGAKVLSVVNSFGAGAVTVQPSGTNYNGAGFFVLGPSDGTLPSAYQTPGAANSGTAMTYIVPLNDPKADSPVPPTILLRRLANPNLPYQPSTIAPNYNPYVTVDYVDMNAAGASTYNDARTYNANGPNAGVVPVASRYSYGRTQPYAGAPTLMKRQQPNPAVAGAPQNTFNQHNAVETTAPPSAATAGQTLKVPFDWLVHLDRPLLSPVELLHVSGFKPHELTQQFVVADGTPFGASFKQMAPWQDPSARLYRLLEFVKVKSVTPGIVNGGRVPGKVNINTLDATIDAGTGLPTSAPVFEAICDAEPGNTIYNATGMGSTDAYVDQVFKNLMLARTPGGTPGANDQPFWGMAQGASPNPTNDAMGTTPRGIAQTLLNPTLAAGASPYNGAAHPYQKLELLNKLFNNVTTRSNVFAVWLTVGFFQITNDQVQPMQLGPEINLAQGRNIRHHMFAVVDRTQIQTFSTTSTVTIPAPTAPATSVSAAVTLAANPVPDPRTGRTWTVGAGSTLVYDPNTGSEETVVVQAGLTANFTLAHAKGAPVISRGHPGPWTSYSPSQDSNVVPYWVIID